MNTPKSETAETESRRRLATGRAPFSSDRVQLYSVCLHGYSGYSVLECPLIECGDLGARGRGRTWYNAKVLNLLSLVVRYRLGYRPLKEQAEQYLLSTCGIPNLESNRFVFLVPISVIPDPGPAQRSFESLLAAASLPFPITFITQKHMQKHPPFAASIEFSDKSSKRSPIRD